MSEPKNITQIISLPRSRTAWLSVALTAGNCFAFHDGCNPPNTSAADYLAKLNSPHQENIVDCSSHLLLRHDLIEAANCPIIIIERDPDDAKESLIKHIGKEWLVNKLWPSIIAAFDETENKFAKRIKLHVGFEELANNDSLALIQSEVAPDFPYDRVRLSVLQNLNIQEGIPTWAGA